MLAAGIGQLLQRTVIGRVVHGVSDEQAHLGDGLSRCSLWAPPLKVEVGVGRHRPSQAVALHHLQVRLRWDRGQGWGWG
jgi:hypothetical protein